MDMEALTAELLAGHPVTGAYSGDHKAAAAEMNAENLTTERETLSGNELFTATDGAEFIALTAEQRQLWVSWCNTHRDPWDTSNIQFVSYVFGAGSSTIIALSALRTRPTSRAEELGFGAMKAGYVQRARAG